MANVVDMNKIILAFGINIGIKKERKFILIKKNYEYSNSKPLALVYQSLGPVQHDLAYEEGPHLHCLELAQHSSYLSQARSKSN